MKPELKKLTESALKTEQEYYNKQLQRLRDSFMRINDLKNKLKNEN